MELPRLLDLGHESVPHRSARGQDRGGASPWGGARRRRSARSPRESQTWAVVDFLAIQVAGPLVVRFPDLGAVLDRWATDSDFWVRRAAMLALLLPLRRGARDFERFSRYADGMLEEKEFFIRKAIGWGLREAAKKGPQLVGAWVAPRIPRA